ncbi:MAG TPA: ABC transporter substrate-binding protein [Candidatus Mediterraneibacter faecipullorum]|uniref:ABC transporter substrate-binding protein n=1 Tax=Candidatus Mediterraneibacter faecipullorum TaxID=2838670 RepID=A0A9D2SSS7_9FIRM|nr:ABC transporter substrate-binding protein [Candidatus Mediterraneibacter faecipullorum]
MKKRKQILALLMTGAMLFSLSGCVASGNNKESSDGSSTSEDGTVTLSFWSWLPTTEQSDDMIEAFEKENPGIKIDYTRTEQDDFFEKLQVAMASGTGPDLYGMTTGPMMQQYAKFSVDMKETADQYWDGWSDIINETAVEQCMTDDGTMAGMPLLVAGMTTMMYNQTLMDECGVEKVPTTYEELLDAAQKAQEHGYVCMAAGAADDWVNSDWFVQAANEFENGAVYEAEAGERKWTDQCFVDTMQAWKNMFTEGIFEEGALGVATYPDARDQYFFARKSLFFLTGSWHLGPTSPTNSEIQGTEIGNRGDVIGMAPFPSVSESGEMLGTSGVDVMISMNKDCKEQEAAMKFIQFLADGEGQQMWVNYLQGSPVSKNVSYTGTVDGELQQESIDTVNEYVGNAAGNRKLSNSEVEKAIQVAMQNVAAGGDPLTELEGVQAIADAQ